MAIDKVVDSVPQNKTVGDTALVPNQVVLAFNNASLFNIANLLAQVDLHKNGNEHFPHTLIRLYVHKSLFCQVGLYFQYALTFVVTIAFLGSNYYNVVLCCVSK
jgi:hypothetical protein